MAKNLVIVESPAKARTIERYLGPGYRVLASYGHVRDLPENPGKNKLGVDVEHDFKPEYVVTEDRKKQVATIAKEAKAPTPSTSPPTSTAKARRSPGMSPRRRPCPRKGRRVTFSEITPDAINDAFAHPREIDHNLVDAQQTRRILDRLVGYTLSPLLWRKVRAGLSAGRVQSVAVRLVVEREREITLHGAGVLDDRGCCSPPTPASTFSAELTTIDGKKAEIGDGETAERHAAALRETKPVVDSVATRRPSATRRRRSRPRPCSRRRAASSASPDAHDAHRAGPVRGHGHRRRARRPDHLHAHRLDHLAGVAEGEARR